MTVCLIQQVIFSHLLEEAAAARPAILSVSLLFVCHCIVTSEHACIKITMISTKTDNSDNLISVQINLFINIRGV